MKEKTYGEEMAEHRYTDLVLVSDLIDVSSRYAKDETPKRLQRFFDLMAERGEVIPRSILSRVPCEEHYPPKFGEKTASVTWKDAGKFASLLGLTLGTIDGI